MNLQTITEARRIYSSKFRDDDDGTSVFVEVSEFDPEIVRVSVVTVPALMSIGLPLTARQADLLIEALSAARLAMTKAELKEAA